MEEFELAIAFYENQVFSFSSTGKNFAITKKDMTKRFGRLIAACARLRNATIMHRDYKDCISYAAGNDTFILLDPPYKGTEDYYQKSSFGSDEHAKLFSFMNDIHEQFHGDCKFLITYNNDPYIRELADHYGFDSYVQERLHNMRQGTKPGDMFEELLISYLAIAESDGMRDALCTIAASQSGVLFHCTAGKDRTGVLSAILLLHAGVPDGTVIQDYTLTKEYGKEILETVFRMFSDADRDIITPHPEHMKKFIKLFREKYLSTDIFMQRIGLSLNQRKTIRDKLRIGNLR